MLCNYLQNVAAITYIFVLQLSTFLFYNKQSVYKEATGSGWYCIFKNINASEWNYLSSLLFIYSGCVKQINIIHSFFYAFISKRWERISRIYSKICLMDVLSLPQSQVMNQNKTPMRIFLIGWTKIMINDFLRKKQLSQRIAASTVDKSISIT